MFKNRQNRDIIVFMDKKNGSKEFVPKNLLTSAQILNLMIRVLHEINPELGVFASKTAYLAALIAQKASDTRITIRNSILLGLLNQCGTLHFYGEKKVRPSDLSYEELHSCYHYAYYYLKEMTPLGDVARAVLFYDKKYDENLAKKNPLLEYASLIFSSSSIVNMLDATKLDYSDLDLKFCGVSKFNPRFVNIFKIIDESRTVSTKLQNGQYLDELYSWCDAIVFNPEETKQLLSLLIYLMDFKSTQTVQHTIHAACYAVSIGRFAGCSETELNELFTAGIVHDIGKMAIPSSILEAPGRLRSWEYTVMKQHVVESEKILRGVMPGRIFDIAVRHHEKLNGNGYPHGLVEKQITLQQRLMVVADVLSALIDRRSYKDEYDKNKILSIFADMTDNGEIDERFSSLIPIYFDRLKEDSNRYGALLSVPLGLVEVQYQEEMSGSVEL